MAQVIGVRFKDVGKIYYFDPLDLEIVKGSRVIVETARGVECGEVAMERKEVSDEGLVQPLKPVIRIATEEDLRKIWGGNLLRVMKQVQEAPLFSLKKRR